MSVPLVASVITGYSHQALFYAGDREFYARTLPFIREGIAGGEPVLVAVSEPKIAGLKRRLRGDAEMVRFLELTALGRNPARIIPAWREFVAEHASGLPIRGIGEPAWPGRSAEEFDECDRHESLLNLAFDDLAAERFQLLCPYDTETLPADVVAAARRNHPELVDGAGCAHSAEYCRPGRGHDPLAGALEPAPADAEHLRFEGAPSLSAVRRFAWAAASEAGLDRSAQSDLALCVNELAANSILHAAGDGLATIWTEDGALICQVEDDGRFDDPLAGRRRPEVTQLSGRGLWLVNQLCDLVQVRSSTAGSVVRIRITAGSTGPAPATVGS